MAERLALLPGLHAEVGPVTSSDSLSHTLLVDTREQLPYDFASFGAEVERHMLPAGDYSVEGYETRAAIERKEPGDLVACLMGDNRVRFERELAALRGYSLAAVVVEAPMDDIARHRYRSRMKPHAVLQSIFTFQVRYRMPFIWAGNRSGAEYTTYWLLAKFERERRFHERTDIDDTQEQHRRNSRCLVRV